MVEESTAFVIAFGVLLFIFSLISRKISGSMVTNPIDLYPRLTAIESLA